MTVEELLEALAHFDRKARVVIARWPKRISERAADIGEVAVCGKRPAVEAVESCDGDLVAIIYDPQPKRRRAKR